MENKHKQFAPYDRVLVRDSDSIWRIDFYSHRNEDWNHVVLSFGPGLPFLEEDILPYEGNEHLVGTHDEPEEEVKLEKGEYIIASDIIYSLRIGSGVIGRFVDIEDRMFLKRAFERNDEYRYAIRFSDFNPNDMEETRKHILCVKDGKVVKYKE